MHVIFMTGWSDRKREVFLQHPARTCRAVYMSAAMTTAGEMNPHT
jgi:hypothetical protein